MARDTDHRRVFPVMIPLLGPLAAAAGVATYAIQLRSRIMDVELSLADTGAGAGNTSVDVKLNGNSILAGALSIAGGAAGKTAQSGPANPVGEPSGVDADPDDEITVDVTAVPGTTPPAGGFITLACAARDV